MNVFVAYKSGGFETAEVRVPCVSQKYDVDINTRLGGGWGVIATWRGRRTTIREFGLDEYGEYDDIATAIEPGQFLAEVACHGSYDTTYDEYMHWLNDSVDLIEVDGRPFYVNPSATGGE